MPTSDLHWQDVFSDVKADLRSTAYIRPMHVCYLGVVNRVPIFVDKIEGVIVYFIQRIV